MVAHLDPADAICLSISIFRVVLTVEGGERKESMIESRKFARCERLG